MDQRQFRDFIAAGVVQEVVIHDRGQGWEVWAFGEQWPIHVSNRLRQQRRDRSERTWSDLGRAFQFVRSQGWPGPVKVEDHALGWEERYQTDPEATDANWQAYRARITG
jgi:hypothetical protein